MLLPRSLPSALGSPHMRDLPISPRLLSFAVIGVVCTVAFGGIFWALRQFTGPIEANFGALSSTIIFNFAANRRLTFRAHRGPIARQAAAYAVVYVVGLGASSAALWLVLELFSHPTGFTEVVLATGASGVATVARYAMLTRWVFPAKRLTDAAGSFSG
ncbi:MAG: GtrA family protein [bacterium]